MAPDPRRAEGFYSLSAEKAIPLSDLSGAPVSRFKTGISEFDRVLGGGFVPGSVVLLGGDPGIGKSTLVLQALDRLSSAGHRVLYISGEESADQIKLRADRLGVHADLLVLTENNLEKSLAQAAALKPSLLVLDSIQTAYLPGLESAPGSMAQVRECSGKLLYFSKASGTASILVGHVTKEGGLAGPKMLEHMVDTVLYFEGEKSYSYRILRTMKNRFGSTNEIGVFEMSGAGLVPVDNPSGLFLAERPQGAVGSVVTAAMEGSRPLLLEVQALVAGSGLANPRRTAIGVEASRVALLVAVLEKLVGLPLYDQDIYVNVAGGLKVSEPAIDLAILVALVSSFKNKPLDPQTVIFGEVGLSGEVRSVSHLEARLGEARKLGFTRVIMPKSPESAKNKLTIPAGLSGIRVASVLQALEAVG